MWQYSSALFREQHRIYYKAGCVAQPMTILVTYISETQAALVLRYFTSKNNLVFK